jgi:hypothetical protein
MDARIYELYICNHNTKIYIHNTGEKYPAYLTSYAY